MGNGCTRLVVKPVVKPVDIKPDSSTIIQEQYSNMSRDICKINEKIDDIYNILTRLENKFDKQFPQKIEIPVARSYQVYNINGKKITIPWDTCPLDTMEILEWHKKNS